MSAMTDLFRPLPGAYPEMQAADGSIRNHWQPMLRQLENYGAADIDERWKRAQRMIRENGVTYNVYEDEKGSSHPWMLDPVPLMLDPGEWDELSAGLVQRTQVLNLALADLYSEQNLLKTNVLPSELLYANPGFLRPCCQIRPPGGHYLTLHAVDLARTPSGKWNVVKDLTQTPPGAGYALENRLMMSRTFPTMYRECHVERLAPFFITLRNTLENLASGKANPHIVVLTPGSHSSSYFEQAYIARYLGYPLVVGNDLTVRGNEVFLKTLSGLRKVDVILRRQADSLCDPLELAGDSLLGIPGLLQAAVDGKVAIANALGSGLAETPALLPFFPSLCRNLTGEEPRLNTLPTLWCGQEKECQQVLGQLDRWVIKRAFTHNRETPVFVRSLAPADRAALAERIKAEPDQFIAQESVALSSSPCWQNTQLVPRNTMLRVFIVAAGTGWKVMAGGLVRTSPQADSPMVSMESGGGSKDAWLPARGAVEQVSLLPPDESAIKPLRSDANLSSRVADNLFWLGRYVQRADMNARLLRTILRRLTEEGQPYAAPELAELIRTLLLITDSPAAPHQPVTDPIRQSSDTRTLIFSMIFDRTRPGNLHNALISACKIGSTVRERISIDTWRILDRMNGELNSAPSGGDLPEALDMLDRLLMPLAAFSGLSSESMTHGYGWRFMDMGFRIERAVMSALILQEMLTKTPQLDTPVLDAILEVAHSSMTYRSRYQSHVAPLPLLDLLLCDDSNPRSIAYQLEMISQHACALSALTGREELPEQTLATELVQRIKHCDLKSLVQTNGKGLRVQLNRLLAEVIERVQEISNLITHRYLAHVDTTSQLASAVGSDSWSEAEDAE